ncbi:hypothetical protein AB395_00001627 [Sinorhizobium fredii CCBAU 45436]|nr:hypothetical protein SF83666_c15830 [Sinorhizobium fredii CCBAU 83666]AWI57283.1 hypothetical protein AB395_00001627 [Sinorhizobium fredii CCBAU 45436]AWM25143.1 hypothetical protein AOX55_00001889 [Sinorhizobium fredii CCBAU 25509]
MALRHGSHPFSGCAKNRPRWEITGRVRNEWCFQARSGL